MSLPELVEQFDRALEAHRRSSAELARLAEQVAIASIVEVLPTAASIEVLGEFDEDSIPRLRVQRVLDGTDGVLFDIGEGHADRAVEDAVDEVDIEYLDVLIDLTGDRYLGATRNLRPWISDPLGNSVQGR